MQSQVSLDLRHSEIAMQAIREERACRGRAVVVAVADAQGDPISLVRLDGHLSPGC